MKKSGILFSVLVASIIPGLCSAQGDRIFDRKKGTATQGMITAVGPIKVTLQSTGIAREFDVRDILKVVFGDEPAELTRARDQALDGRYGDALDELKKIDMAQIANDVIRQDVGYYKAYCLAKLALFEGGDKAAALNALLGFIQQNSTTFHLFEGAELLGDLAMALGKYDDAVRYYGALAKAPWPEYQMRADVLRARALVAAGKYAEALPGFEKVLASPVATAEAVEQKMHATVGKAVCLAATGQFEQGIQLIEDLIAKNDPSDAALFGRAYNALGACYEKAGKPYDALLAYLHTHLLFFRDPDAHAEALYHLSKLWTQVGNSERSVRARSLLQLRYAGTRWAAMK